MIVDGLVTNVNTAREDSSEYLLKHLRVLNEAFVPVFNSGETGKHACFKFNDHWCIDVIP